MLYIDTQNALDEICQKLSFESIISIDTEFERRTTYYARPSLVQVVSQNFKVIIDLLKPFDLEPFKIILSNERILKILHSPREDFEIFYRLFKILPANFFDTQIAAKICGMGASLSYGDLCRQICDVEINKKYQKANWLKRPIKSQMLEYAINDSLYLEPIYHHLKKIIEDRSLINSFDEQMRTLANVKNYQLNVRDAWKRVSFVNRSPEFTNRMQAIAAFREECASDADVPRRHFLGDHELVKICNFLPDSEQSLMHLHLSSRHLSNQKYKNKLFDLCAGLKENI